MSELQITMLLHFVGIGILSTALLGGIILSGQYNKASDYKAKVGILKAMRPLGLLSPVAILVMVISGVGNWHAVGWPMLGWLHIKITLFVLAAVLGTIFGMRAKKRAGLVIKLAEGNPSDESVSRVAAMDKQFKVFYVIQTILILSILFLSVVKPGQYAP